MNVADGVALAGVHQTPADVVRAISSTIPDGLLVLDDSRRLVFVNRRAEEILQSPISGSLGLSIEEAVPLWDSEGRLWWDVANPWRQLQTVEAHREKLLATGSGVEVLATARYLRP